MGKLCAILAVLVLTAGFWAHQASAKINVFEFFEAGQSTVFGDVLPEKHPSSQMLPATNRIVTNGIDGYGPGYLRYELD